MKNYNILVPFIFREYVMKWRDLLSSDRTGDRGYTKEIDRPFYVKDSDRITFSHSFKRLANKTQVHPLYENDHLHHRLIHSIEARVVGRSLGAAVGRRLKAENLIDSEQHQAIAGVVNAACLAHDIGNPPFGHAGEAAIGEWFAINFNTNNILLSTLSDIKRSEFLEFEGNAQGFRILTRLEMHRNHGGMRLSNAVLGAFTKYPTTCYIKNKTKSDYCGQKKFGLFESDISVFSVIAKNLGLIEEKSANGTWWRRHPLVFLVEAADDICYNILDLEDAFLSGDVDFITVKDILSSLVPEYSANGADKKEIISSLRAHGINKAIYACVDAFIENYDAIMTGTFSSGLIEESKLRNEFGHIKSVSWQQIFKSPRKTQLEILGRKVIHNVLDGILPLYTDIMENGWNYEKISSYNEKLSRALDLNISYINNEYDALHSMTDFVSGMTDRFALKISKMLSGSL